MSADPASSRRFDVALSFPGEHRDFVEKVAGHLVTMFPQKRVLYDKFYEAEFARPDLDVYLPGLYRTQSELIVIFLCPEYAAKRWCRLEWRNVRQLIPTVDASRIMFLRFGYEGDFSELGIFDGDGTINFEGRSEQDIAERIRERFVFNEQSTAPKPATIRSGPVRADLSRILKYAPAELIGREDELKLLNDAWTKTQDHDPKHPHILTFVALGGEGKTSLVAKWAADLAHRDWPGCDAVFAWSFYSQGSREQTAVSSDLFLVEALTFFGDEAMAKSAAGAFDKGRRLAQLVGERRALLILDGLEPLQYSPTSPTPGELKDQGLASLLKGLAATSHGLCVVTTRYALPDLRAFLGKTVREEKLTRLARAAGVQLLKAHGVTGSDRPNLPHTDDAGKKEMLSEFEALVEDVDGHALTLHLMGSFLKRAFQGDIRRRDRVTFAKADQKTDNGHAFRAMAAYEQWLADGSEEARRELALLSLMGLFDRPATADCLQALLKAPAIAGLTEPLVGLPEEDWNGSLTALQDARLLTVNRDAAGTLLSLDAHPLIREYFGERMKDEGRR